MQRGDDGQRFLPLNAEEKNTLAAFVNQGDGVYKDAVGCKISSYAFDAYRDHWMPPLVGKDADADSWRFYHSSLQFAAQQVSIWRESAEYITFGIAFGGDGLHCWRGLCILAALAHRLLLGRYWKRMIWRVAALASRCFEEGIDGSCK